jgi:gliding motility-associated-like protein
MMKRLFTRLVLLAVSWLSVTTAYSQSMALDVAPRVVCLGTPTQVDAYLSGVSVNDVSSYRFDWGNGDSSINNTGIPISNTRTYQYVAAGVYQITVTARFTNRAPISASFWDTVYNKPIADFQLTSLDSQCFKYNSYCFKDLTQQAAFPSLPLNILIGAYGDGDSSLVSQGATFCHTFGQGNRKYTISLTTTDIGGCRTQAFKTIFVAPNINPRFSVSGTPKCDTTPYIFVNNTPVSTSNLLWFRWEYGDDSVYQSSSPIVSADLPRWSNFTYKYTKNGVFNPMLIVRHKQFNCADTFIFANSGNQLPENIVLKYDIRSRRNNSNDSLADSVCLSNRNNAGVCLYNNYPLQGVNSQIQLLWDFADPNANPPGSDKKLNEVTPCYRYQGMGHYFPILYVACPGQPLKIINFWSRIDTAQLSDSQYAPPPIVNPNLNTINGYFFQPNDSISKYRWIMGSNGLPRDSIVQYWKWFTDDPAHASVKKKEAQLQGYGVNIMGPLVRIEKTSPPPILIKPYLKNQCGPDLPVEFVNSSEAYQSNNLYMRWDFADNYAPRCTSFATPNPSAPNGGKEPYTTANDMFNRTLGRFITGGVIYPGRVNCNFSHDTLPIHQFENWKTIFRWFYYGHDFPPFDSTNWAKDASKITGLPGAPTRLVHPLDSSTWGIPLYSAGVTPARTDTLGKMWPADINPNRPITLNGPIPDPFANAKGYWNFTIPGGTRVDTNGFLQPPLQDKLPDGSLRNYRGNMILPGSNMTLYEYFFNRSIAQCYTVKLFMKDSFNNQSQDAYKGFTRLDMVGGKIIIQQKTDTTPGSPVIHTSDTFSTAGANPSIRMYPDYWTIINSGTGYVDGIDVYVTGGSGTGMMVHIFANGAGSITGLLIKQYGSGYINGDLITIPGGSGTAVFKIESMREGLIYNYKFYPLELDLATSTKYILIRDDEFFVDFFDCGSEATVQLPLVAVDAYGLGKDGKECPGLKNGQSGGDPRFVFDNSAGNPGTYPDCSQRTFILLNYDSLMDRNDNTPCALDGFVSWDGTSPMTGNNVTPGGRTFPPFFNSVNFPPLNPWTGASGAVNWTHYIPAGPSAYSNMPVDRKGFVTVGVILGSGCATFACDAPACLTDTIWYNKFFHFITLDASFTYRKVGGYSVYGNPSKLPSQDFYWDTTSNFVQPNPVAPPPLLFTPNGNYRQPYSQLFGKGDILEFDATTKQQDYILADVWDWGDGTVTVDSFYTNQVDTFVVLDPVNYPNDSAFFEKNTFPLNRVRYQFATETFPWTILDQRIPYPVGVNVFSSVRFDTIWQCWDLTHSANPQSITRVNTRIDTAFFLHPVQHQYVLSSWEMPAGPGSPMRKNEITEVQHNVVTVTECANNASRQLVIGVVDTFTMKEGDDYSDGILCVGQSITFIDSIRYWFPFSSGAYNPSRPLPPGVDPLLWDIDMHGMGMINYPNDTMKVKLNPTKYYSTINNSCPNGWQFFSQGTAPSVYNFCVKYDTSFFERIYWDFESDGIIDYAGKNPTHQFSQPGKFKVSMISRDTVGYFDTCFMYVDVVQPKAHFTSKGVFECSDPTIFYDSSYVIDNCYAMTGFPCDQIKERRWWFGDYGYGAEDYRSTLLNPYYPYRKNGWYRVQEVIETNQGCFDTTRQDIYISGPRPRIKLLNDTLGCVPYKIRVVSYPNDSGSLSATGSTLIRSGRSDGGWNTISVQNPDTVTIIYDQEGVYYITAIGYDKNPPASSLCPPVFLPDTVNGLEKPIKIYVKNPYHVELNSTKQVVCVGEIFNVLNRSDMDTITKFRMYAYNEDFSAIADTVYKTNFDPDSSFKYIFYQTGKYNLVMHSARFIPNAPACESRDTIQMQAVKAKADLKIDSLGLPRYFVWNRSDSANASNYVWRVYNPDGSLRTEVFVPSNQDPMFNLGELDFKNDTGEFTVCIWATTSGIDNCYDSTCQKVSNNFQIDIKIPNVFTPNGDGSNDVFNIKIKGQELYDLKIWNRWGGQVFESTDANIMWNGKTNNTGAENPEGTYYFVFRYKLRTAEEQTVRGSITLLRN